MPPADVLVIFFLSALLLALAPGPDNLFVLARSAQLVLNRLAGTLFAALAIKLALFRN